EALLGSTLAVFGHDLVDVLIVWFRRSLEQCSSSHDLSRLAIAALGHVDCRPCLLHGMRAVGGEPLYGDNPVGRFHVCDADRAGALHFVVDVDGAGAALSDAT